MIIPTAVWFILPVVAVLFVVHLHQHGRLAGVGRRLRANWWGLLLGTLIVGAIGSTVALLWGFYPSACVLAFMTFGPFLSAPYINDAKPAKGIGDSDVAFAFYVRMSLTTLPFLVAAVVLCNKFNFKGYLRKADYADESRPADVRPVQESPADATPRSAS